MVIKKILGARSGAPKKDASAICRKAKPKTGGPEVKKAHSKQMLPAWGSPGHRMLWPRALGLGVRDWSFGVLGIVILSLGLGLRAGQACQPNAVFQ